jgi:RNA polymerase sigma-32 factor
MSSSLTLPSIPSEGGLSQYFREVWSFPMLDKEEEQMLAIRWRDYEDTDAAHKLVTSHLRLVAKIAMGYRGYGLPVADLVSEGNIGLMKAVKKFDPDLGYRLSTYAMWWIRATITEHVLKSWSMVKMGTVSSQKKLFFSLRKLKNKLNIIDNGELTDEQATRLSDALGESADDIHMMNRRISGRDLSLNAPVGHEEDSGEFIDSLVDDTPSPEAQVAQSEELALRSQMLHKVLRTLKPRERRILKERKLRDDPKTLEELGAIFNISRERVRQIEKVTMEKVEKGVRALALKTQSAEAV